MMQIDTFNLNNIFNSIGNNTQKASTNSESNSNSFDSMFTNASCSNSSVNQTNGQREVSQVSQQTSRHDYNYSQNDSVKNKSTSEDDNSKPVPKEVKDALKRAGMSEEEVDKIKSLKDLKEKVDPNNLLTILLSLANGNFANMDLSNIKDKLEEQIKSIINDNSQNYVNVTNELELKNKLIDGLFDKVSSESASGNLLTKYVVNDDSQKYANITGESQLNNSLIDGLFNKASSEPVSSILPNTGNKEDMLLKVQQELSAALKDSLKDIKANKKGTEDLLSSLKLISKNLNAKPQEETVQSVKDDNTSDDSSMSNSKSSKGDDDFLKNLLSDNNDNVSRVTSFMSQFNNVKVDNNAVGDLENVVINKDTLNADMIKALKYMQTNDMKDLTIKINPKELGEVVIKITMESGIMKANISTTNKEAYNLINSNLADISNKLQSNDIKIQDVSLNMYNEDTTFFKDGSNRDRSGNGQKGKNTKGIDAIGEGENEIYNDSTIDSNVNILA